jgi:hypothetical protein
MSHRDFLFFSLAFCPRKSFHQPTKAAAEQREKECIAATSQAAQQPSFIFLYYCFLQ